MPPGSLRRIADAFTEALARLILRVFFREVEVVGLERVPRGGPLLVVANHVNSLVDPILVLGFLGARPRFLAKSTLFAHPVVAPLLLLAGALPVYRRGDAGEDVSRNLQTFARCRRHLAAGGAIALFPEGTSHNQPHGLPLKTGAARIALEAEHVHGPLGLRVLPVGITYEDKGRFRSRVLIRVGEPIVAAAGSPVFDRGGIRALTARIAAGLDEVRLSFASWGEARLVDQALAMAFPHEDWSRAPLSRLWSLRRTALERYRALATADPDRAARVVSALARSGPDPAALGPGEAGPARRRSTAQRVLLVLPALAGVVLNVVPYRIPGWIAERATRTPDEPATYKVLAALVAFPLCWGLEVAAAAMLGWPWAVGMAVAAPLTAWAALLRRDDARAALEERRRRRRSAGQAPSRDVLEDRARLRDELMRLAG